MRRTSRLARAVAVMTLALGLGACVTSTAEKPYGTLSEVPLDFQRGVEVDLTDAYYSALPDCVVVMPSPNADAAGQDHIWRARHVAARSDGSLPLSPLSLIVGAFEATSLETDADLPASMADDVARRLIATLPDLRMGHRPEAGLSPVLMQ